MSTMSKLVSRLALALAIVLLPFAVLAAWVETVLTDTDHYVASVTPLAADPVVKLAAQDRLAEAVLIRTPPKLRGPLTPLVNDVAARVIGDEAFAVAWAEANRSAHLELIAVLSGKESALAADDGRISIELDALLLTMVEILDAENLVEQLDLPQLQASFTLVEAADARAARAAYAALEAAGLWLPLVLVVLVLAAVLFAPDRRRTLRWLGYGAIVAAAMLAGAQWLTGNHLVASVAAEDQALVRAVWDIITQSLDRQVLVIAATGVAIAIVTWLSARPNGRRAHS